MLTQNQEKKVNSAIIGYIKEGLSEAEIMSRAMFVHGSLRFELSLGLYLKYRLAEDWDAIDQCNFEYFGRGHFGCGQVVFLSFPNLRIRKLLWPSPVSDQIIEACERFFAEPVELTFVHDSALDERSFYKSQRWIDLRYKAITRSKGKCEACGRAKRDGIILHVDHVKPRAKYPSLQFNLDKLQVLCADCKIGKSKRDETDWRKKV